MDRRDFLKTGSAAVAAGAAVAAPAGAAETARAPAVLSGAEQLTLASSWGPHGPGLGPERLARRIETATAGRYRIEIVSGPVDADLGFGAAGRHAHPAFAVFAGLPFGQGLGAAAQQTWLAVGGGQMLWDELAADLGFKPLVAGHSGASGGVWATARLEQVSDLAGAPIGADGFAADVLRALGAVPVAIDQHEVRAALAEGRIRAADWLGQHTAPDLQPLAQRLYQPGFHPGGMVLSLDVRLSLWERMSAADQAILEACAAEEHRVSLAEAQVHGLIAGQLETPAKWPVRRAFAPALSQALAAAARDTLARLAASSDAARRIHDSHQAFRRMLGEPQTA